MKLIKSFKNAIIGIKDSLKEELNLKIHLIATFCVIIAGIIFNISTCEWIICILLCGLVISGEIFNTAIENIIDFIDNTKHLSEDSYDKNAKLAKDAAAGSLLILAIISVIIGLIIFIPKIFLYL